MIIKISIISEVEDINKSWEEIGSKLNMSGADLKEKILPMTAIYSVAEHTRALLVALTDGVLPSNVGGGYNLRVILRRALSFIDQFDWDIKLKDVCAWHTDELKELFPELEKNLKEVSKILDVETKKYYASKTKANQIVERIVHKEITTETLLKLYDSDGISPEVIKICAAKHGKTIVIPDNFYTLVGELHEKRKKIITEKSETNFDLTDVNDTEKLFWESYELFEFKAKVLKVFGDNVILDKSAFYPTSGGQQHDTGAINGFKVLNVLKQGNHIIHEIETNDLKEGDLVDGKIDKDRRTQLTIHHTATHIINGSAKRILGNHIWQAGASKSVKKARLDITHFDSLSETELQQIEDTANSIVKDNLEIKKQLMPRKDAEEKFGFVLYQGGAVPGKVIRVVNIPDVDVEACGGTHLNRTSEAGKIKILKTSKLQDGIVRIEFTAGKAAEQSEEEDAKILDEIAKQLNVQKNQVPKTAANLFSVWKKVKKAVKKKKELSKEDFEFKIKDVFEGTDDEVLEETAKVLKTQPSHVVNTINRFLKELEDMKKSL